MLHCDHKYQQQQSYPPDISPHQPPLVDRHYSSLASCSEPIQQTQYQQEHQYPTKAFSGANLLSSDTHSIQQHGEATEQTSNQHIPVYCLSYPNSSIQSLSTNQYENLGCQSELFQSQLHQVKYPTNQYVGSGTCMLSSSLPPASAVAQSTGRNSQSSVEYESLVVTPRYSISKLSPQSQSFTSQSRRLQYFNSGHSSSYPPPNLSHTNMAQESSSRVPPQHNLMSPPLVPQVTYHPDLQAPPQPEQIPNFGNLTHGELIQPPRLNLPVHLSDHSSHSPEHMSKYSDNTTIPYDTEAVMQGMDGNTDT